jgi:hypothetical protein
MWPPSQIETADADQRIVAVQHRLEGEYDSSWPAGQASPKSHDSKVEFALPNHHEVTPSKSR